MPEVTVSLRLHSGQSFIAETFASILRQTEVDLELIVVHDGSPGQTVQLLKPFQHPKLRQIINSQQLGETRCRNLVIRESQSPFILHTIPGCILLPGAIQKMVEAIKSSKTIGMVHGGFFDLDADGKVSRDSHNRRRNSLLAKFAPGTDYREKILFHAQLIDGLKMYRREIFNTIGIFNERTRRHAEAEFSLRLLETFDVLFLPQALYCRKTARKKVNFERIKKLKSWCEIVSLYLTLRNAGKLSSLHAAEYRPMKVVLRGLYEVTGLRQNIERFIRVCKGYYARCDWHLFRPISNAGYSLARNVFARLPLPSPAFTSTNASPHNKRIAYFLWCYPELSQTFVQRELAALRSTDAAIHVITESYDESNFLEEYRQRLREDNICLIPMDEAKLKQYKRGFFFNNPGRYVNLLLYVLCRNYHVHKNFDFDRKIFAKSVYLAGILRENNINHIHSPWADLNAFIALVASRLLGISYSVQARAHDVHRKTYLYGLQEKFENAEFVITNTQYNVAHVRNLLNHANGAKIHLIYNGLNLERFQPGRRTKELSHPAEILCVARLIEQKGLIYLLRACHILKEKGIAFRCRIIGGPENPLFMNYYVALMKLHKQLQLEEEVSFLGAQPFGQILAAYQEADIFVLPCVIAENGSRDITPNSLIEAMAMQLPVVSTPVTGIPEIVEDGVEGILVPPNDEIALSEAMLRLIADEPLRLELGSRARRKVEARFDISKNVVHYAVKMGVATMKIES
jgi:glycosyltransferase involved in cell wall biosynthesis